MSITTNTVSQSMSNLITSLVPMEIEARKCIVGGNTMLVGAFCYTMDPIYDCTSPKKKFGHKQRAIRKLLKLSLHIYTL